MRSAWKGKFLTHDYDMFDNKDFYAEYNIFNTNLYIPQTKDNFCLFHVYKGNKFELLVTTKDCVGCTLSAFAFTKKIAKLHENNRLQKKRRAKKLQIKKKSDKLKSLKKGKRTLKKK